MGAAKPTEAKPYLFTSQILRTVNVQTMGADATVEAGEAMNSPGVADGLDGAMYILSVKVSFSPLLATGIFITGVTASHWTTQIQIGERATSIPPVIVDPSSAFYFASRTMQGTRAATDGSTQSMYPIPLDIAPPDPVIVLPQYTVVHKGMNNAAHNDELVFTEIKYRTCIVHSSVYNRLLRSQSRLS